jgi:hypothetical protein
MAEREVKQTGKDKDGDITALCNSGELWSPEKKDDAINDIENNIHKYYVFSFGARTYIHVVDGPNGKYLRTDPDSTTSNNLDDLPDC